MTSLITEDIINLIFTFFDTVNRIKYSRLNAQLYNLLTINDLTTIDDSKLLRLNNSILSQNKFKNLEKLKIFSNMINIIDVDKLKLKKLIVENFPGHKNVQTIFSNQAEKIENNIYPMPYFNNKSFSIEYFLTNISRGMIVLNRPCNDDVKYIEVKIPPNVHNHEFVYDQNEHNLALNFDIPVIMGKFSIFIILNVFTNINTQFNPVKSIRAINYKLYADTDNELIGYRTTIDFCPDNIQFADVFYPTSHWKDFRSNSYNDSNANDFEIIFQ
ncbi:hypothetical protein Catovirus_1_5 [Catovirus CTV1]|uniref:Uncharacterized protein n=1 Tax=Catovirus CTV1 TaxID=1977631 RepID=A0A1V0S8C4_9VIRU|nr:hypothetical protein Catovirus_1_5 [Catovirus CTV1]